MTLSPNQRIFLWTVAIFGLLGPNGVFIYFALFRWSELMAAIQHPVTLAFVIEAFLVMALSILRQKLHDHAVSDG